MSSCDLDVVFASFLEYIFLPLSLSFQILLARIYLFDPEFSKGAGFILGLAELHGILSTFYFTLSWRVIVAYGLYRSFASSSNALCQFSAGLSIYAVTSVWSFFPAVQLEIIYKVLRPRVTKNLFKPVVYLVAAHSLAILLTLAYALDPATELTPYGCVVKSGSFVEYSLPRTLLFPLVGLFSLMTVVLGIGIIIRVRSMNLYLPYCWKHALWMSSIGGLEAILLISILLAQHSCAMFYVTGRQLEFFISRSFQIINTLCRLFDRELTMKMFQYFPRLWTAKHKRTNTRLEIQMYRELLDDSHDCLNKETIGGVFQSLTVKVI
jgi:hypothetical protein